MNAPARAGSLPALTLSLTLAAAAPAVAQTPYVVADLVPGPDGAYALPFAPGARGNTLFLASSDNSGVVSVWRTDGSAAGTVAVGPLGWGSPYQYLFGTGPQPRRDGSFLLGNALISTFAPPRTYDNTPSAVLVRWEGAVCQPPCIFEKLFFVHHSREHGSELGHVALASEIGELFADLRPGPASSDPRDLIGFANQLYFTALDENGWRQLWHTTPLFKNGAPDIARVDLPGTYAAVDGGLFVHENRLYFRGQSSVGNGLFVLDWETDSARFLAPALGWGSVVSWRGRAYLAMTTVGDGSELWTCDDTPGSVRKVADIRPGPEGAGAAHMVAMQDGLLFFADDGVHGSEPWFSDGTESGTRMLADVFPGPGSSRVPGSTTATNRAILAVGSGRRAYFWADDGVHGFELWTTDGTPAGTRLFADLYPGPESSVRRWGGDYGGGYLLESNGLVYFQAWHPQLGPELWAFDPGASTVSVGLPCGSEGREPRIAANDPVLGTTLQIDGVGAPTGAPGLLLLALGAPDPIAWGPCTILPDLAAPLVWLSIRAAADGTWVFRVPVPADPEMGGVRLTTQALLLSATAANGIESTNGLVLTLGF